MKNRSYFPAILLLLCLCAWVCPSSLYCGNGPAKFKLPKYEKFKLDNGLTVYLMEQHEVPLIYVSAVFSAGAIKDMKKHGLASITADALMFGTKSFSKKEMEEQLDFLGATFSSFATLESARISSSFVNLHQDKVFPILKEVICNPIFDQREFDKHKKRLMLQLEMAKERPSRVMRAYFNKFIYGNHVYGNHVSGFKKTVRNFTTNDLKTFYMANYHPSTAAIAIAGDFETAVMKKQVKQMFNGWKPGVRADSKSGLRADSESGVLESPNRPDKSRVLLVNKEDAGETTFYIGQLGIKRSNPDYVAIQVINTILGGRFTSWLNDELRINAGLTYGAGSFFSTYRDSGVFTIGSYTKTAATIKALDLALEVLMRLHKKGIDAKTLESAKNYVKGQFPPDYETSRRLARLMTDMFVYNFDESFINNFEADVDGLTVSGAKKIIKKYFPAGKLQMVLIGKASEIRAGVKKYGTLIEKEIKTDGF